MTLRENDKFRIDINEMYFRSVERLKEEILTASARRNTEVHRGVILKEGVKTSRHREPYSKKNENRPQKRERLNMQIK